MAYIRINEDDTIRVFNAVVTFSASIYAQSVLELCELRNMLLLGGSHYGLVFIDPRQTVDSSKPGSSSISFGHSFYSDYGRPVHATIDGRSILFWPDEWQSNFSGVKSIGRNLFFVHEGAVYEGVVSNFNADESAYEVSFQCDGEEKTLSVDLATVKHWWMPSSVGGIASPSAPERLLFNSQDVGKFLRIWWSRYNRFYYGRVVAFDGQKGTHTITYEDKDTRVYDMRSKDYEIVMVPPEVKKQVVGLQDAPAAQVAAVWHRTKGVHLATKDEAVASANVAQKQEALNSSRDNIPRPFAHLAFNVSLHQINLINLYFDAHGMDNILLSMTDADHAPPSMGLILAHLQFLYQLRSFLNPKKFRGLTWEVKEALAFAIGRFDEQQLKDFSGREFVDIYNLLKDLITIAGEANESVGNELFESLDYMRLNLSIKLIATLKVQKRSLGLSMLKDYIEGLHPKIVPFLSKRYSTVNNRKALGPARSPQPNAQKPLGKIFISVKGFDRWFQRSNFIELLLGDNFHQDLVSKADTIFVYMAHRRLLTDQHLAMLWQCTIGAHEAVVRVLHNLILIIIPALDSTLRNSLFQCISSVHHRDYSVQFIQFVSNFTLQAARAVREEEGRGVSSQDGESEQNKRDGNKQALRSKAQVVNAPQRQYFGFNLLWNIVLGRGNGNETFSVNDDVLDATIAAIVDLLKDEFVDDKDAAMQTCIENIELGEAVPTSLALLRRVLLLYPSSSKSWFVLSRQPVLKSFTITQQVDKLIKQNRLLDVLFAELEGYHQRSLKEAVKTSEEASLRPTRPTAAADKSKGRDVLERLEFLQFIISKASVKLTENQLSILWRVFGESTAHGETVDSLCSWLDALVYSENKKVGCILKLLLNEIGPSNDGVSEVTARLFEASMLPEESEHTSIVDESILVSFFESSIVPWAVAEEKMTIISRPSVASFLIKLFLFANVSRKAIKVDSETAWTRLSFLTGLPVLWRIAMDASDLGISALCSKLLVELQHRSALKVKTPEGVRGNFMQLCFKQLYFGIQNLHAVGEDVAQVVNRDARSEGALPLHQQEWFESNYKVIPKDIAIRRLTRLVATLRQFMCRFFYVPAYHIRVKIFAKNDDLPVCSVKMLSSESVGSLRARVAAFFKESSENMLLYMKDTGDRLDKDSVRVGAMKGQLEMSLVARKAESGPVNSSMSQRSQNTLVSDVPDVIVEDHLKLNFTSEINPMMWVSPSSTESQGRVSSSFPLRSARERVLEEASVGTVESIESIMELLTQVVKANEKYINQLLEMLDGFFAAESSSIHDNSQVFLNVWDILQLFPFQPSLVSQLSKLTTPFSWSHVLDVHNPHRLLYSLQVLDAFFEAKSSRFFRMAVPPDFKLADWCVKFCESGGLDQMKSVLQEVARIIQVRSEENQQMPLLDDDCISGQNLYLTISTFVLRFIRRFLLLDPAFSVWNRLKSLEPTPPHNAAVASGLFLSLIEVPKLVDHVTQLLALGIQGFHSGEVSPFVVCSLCETTSVLTLGLCAASDGGLAVLQSSQFLQLALRKYCTLAESPQVRRCAARSVLKSFAEIYVRCVDSRTDQSQASLRVALLDEIRRCTIDIAVGNGAAVNGEISLLNPHMDSLYNLLAAIEYFTANPASIVKDVNGSSVFDLARWRKAAVSEGEAGSLSHYSYLPHIIQSLTQHRTTESFHSTDSDETLLGLLRIVFALARAGNEPQRLLRQSYQLGEEVVPLAPLIYQLCLFASPSSQGATVSSVLCQAPRSRQLAFAVVVALSEADRAHFHDLVSYLSEGKENSATPKKQRVLWDYDPSALLKRGGEYLGLKNQGGTCYMNSFLQQLFHIRSFREGVLQIAKYASDKEFENVLFQLQVMFGYLKLSQKKFFDTLPFCSAIIDYDGQPISLTEQKDINEFAGMLFDKLEKNTDCNELLKNTIRGTLVWKTKSLETPYRSEREESFYMITLEVKDKKRIEDSLELSVAEELFNGENKIEDSVAGIKVEAIRRAAIRHLPPTLIVQLKRFEFDLETMNRKKLNDFMAFPTELDMFPYTEEGIFGDDTAGEEAMQDNDDEEEETDGKKDKYVPFSKPVRKPESHYQYVLTGIVAHVGAIDRGHYYSFIKDRVSENWYEFNDRLVLPFSPESIPRECFGGADESASGATAASGPPKMRENNAYLLVYERREDLAKSTLPLSTSPSMTNFAAMDKEDASPTSDWSVRSPLGGSGFRGSRISENVLRFIMAENAEFQLDRFRYDRSLFSFIWSLATAQLLPGAGGVEGDTEEGSLVASNLRKWPLVLMRFIVEVAIHARAKSCTKLLIENLQELLTKDKSRESSIGLLMALSSRPEMEATEDAAADTTVSTRRRFNAWLETVFFECPHGQFVFALRGIMKTVLTSLSSKLEREWPDVQDFLKAEPAVTSSANSVDEAAGPEAAPLSPQEHASRFVDSLPVTCLTSYLASFCDQLLTIVERSTADDVYFRDGEPISAGTVLLWADFA